MIPFKLKIFKNTDKIQNFSELEIQNLLLEFRDMFPQHICYPKNLAEELIGQILQNHDVLDECTDDSENLEILSAIGIRGLVTEMIMRRGKNKDIFVVLEIDPDLLNL